VGRAKEGVMVFSGGGGGCGCGVWAQGIRQVSRLG